MESLVALEKLAVKNEKINLAVVKPGTEGCANYHFTTCQS